MPDDKTMWMILIPVTVIGVVVWELLERRSKAKQHLKCLELGVRSFEPQFRAPDWSCYERHLRRPVPTAISELYRRFDLLLNPTGADYPGTEGINCFQPITLDSLAEAKECYGVEIMPIALSGSGDPIYLKPDDPSNAVYVLTHGSGESIFEQDATTFLSKLTPTKT